MTRFRGLIIGAVTLVTIVLTVVFASRFGADPRLAPSPLIGTRAPELTFTTAEGAETVTLQDFGGDIVVVNFWAPWCVPCRDEHPALLSIAEDFSGSDVTVLGVAYQSAIGDIIAFLDELGRGYPVVMDDRSRAAIGFGVRGVPETYFVDRDGTIVAKVTGPITYDLVAATLDRIILGLTPESVKTGELQVSP